MPDNSKPSYSWNEQTYNSLRQSLLVALKNAICIKSYMAPQDYKFFPTHAHEIQGWNILSITLHAQAPNLGGMNGDFQSELATLDFNQGGKL